jgi:hypothetical protein
MNRNQRTSTGRVKSRSLIVALVVTASALVLSSAAYAAGSAQQTYGGKGGNVQAQIQGGAKDPGTGTAAASKPAGLAFTGLDLTLMLGGGLVLMASGMALSRLMVRRARV